MSNLSIPLSTGMLTIPLGISQEEFDCIRRTLKLWEDRIVDSSQITVEELDMISKFKLPQETV